MKHWKNLGKRGLALFLVLMMCMTLLPTAAFAVEEETIPCEACEGRGMVESACPDCGGTGKVSVTSACPDCEEPAECPACNGTGEVTGEVTADCKACSGTGTVTDPETEELADCKACEGTGKTTEEGLVSCEACADWEEPETCATCNGTRQVTTAEDCAACEGTGTVEHTCTACGGTGTVVKTAEPPEENPVDTEAIAAAIGEVAGELQDLGDRFGAFQEEFFWNLTGDEKDPMADFTAAAAAEFGKEFNVLLAKFKAIPAEVTETEYAGAYADLRDALQMMADAMGGDLNSGINALADMSWQWTVTVFGGNYYRADGTESSTNKYTINRRLDNSVSHEIGCSFVWNSSAGGSSYSGGWQLVLTVDGSIVERTTAYIYDRDMSTASETWTAPASSHTGTSTHPFIFYASNYPKADYSKTKTFTLNYNANGGTNLSKAKDTYSGAESTHTFTPNATASRTGYTFGGWSTTSGASNAGNKTTSVSVSAGGSKTVYAIWTPIDYTKPALTGISKTLTGVTVNGEDKGASVPNTLTVGDVVVLTYKITVTGDADAKYTVTDPGAKLNDTDEDTVSGTIPAGATQVEITATKTVTVALSDTKISNTAYVKPTNDTTKPIDPTKPGNDKTPDLDKGYPSDPVENDVTVVPADKPELTITKSAPKGVKVGGDLEYTITVTNTGKVDATGVVVTDTLPEQLAGYITKSDPGYNLNNGVYSWNLGTIPAGQSKEIKFTAPGKSGVTGSAKNTAYVTADGITDPVPSNEVETKLFKLTPTKEHEKPISVAGSTATIKYTVTIKNESGFDLYGLDIIDTLKKPEITSGTASLKLKPTSLTTTDESVKVMELEGEFGLFVEKNENETHIFHALDRSTVFKNGSTVTLKYDVIVTNTGKDQLVLRVSNVAKGGCWTTDGTEAQMFRMMARSGSGYDAESEEVGDNAGVGDDATVVIPPAQGHKVTIKYVDEKGAPISGKSDDVFYADKDTGAYNVTNEIAAPSGYAIISIAGKTEGTTDTDVTITVKCGVDAYKPTSPTDPTKKDGGDGIPDKFQPVVTYKVSGGTWDGTDKADKEYVFTLYEKDDTTGEWTKLTGDKVPKLADTVPTGMAPDATHVSEGAAWKDSAPESTTPVTGNVTYTYSFSPKTEGPTVTVKDTDGTDKGTWKEDPEKDKTLTPDDEGKVKLPGKGDITPPDGKVLEKWKDEDSDTTYEPGADITPDKNLTLVPVWKDIGSDETLTADVKNVTATYDGQGHPVTDITVTDSSGNPVGYTVTYDTRDGNAPVDAGTYTATVKVGDNVVGTATVTIGRRPVTLTSANASKTYDGTALTNHNVTVGGLGFVPGQGATYAFTGSQTTVNSSPNYFTYALTAGTLAANYNITVSYGTLTVSRRTGGGGGGGTGGGGTGGGGTTGGTGGTGGTGSGTTTINDGAVPLAGDLQLNKTDHFAYIKGYQDGTVRPNNPLTRAQVATIFYRLLDETSRIIYFQETNDFTDVADDFWACKAISTLTNAGIITGFQDGTFRPNAYITRAQFAAIAARFDNVVPGLENPFSDVSEDYWARDLIAYAASKGWIEGESGKFRPLENITRVEAMDFINNVLDRHVDEKGILAGATTFTDVPVTDPNYYVVEEATNSHDYTRRSEGQLMENWTKLNPDPVWEE